MYEILLIFFLLWKKIEFNTKKTYFLLNQVQLLKKSIKFSNLNQQKGIKLACLQCYHESYFIRLFSTAYLCHEVHIWQAEWHSFGPFACTTLSKETWQEKKRLKERERERGYLQLPLARISLNLDSWIETYTCMKEMRKKGCKKKEKMPHWICAIKCHST